MLYSAVARTQLPPGERGKMWGTIADLVLCFVVWHLLTVVQKQDERIEKLEKKEKEETSKKDRERWTKPQ
ncbi:MAG: hypothetical protein A2507_00340 [Candidatus Magasanikbacteria bacterium RIFOXYD12_FULL_33_17]|nr:MAG: hypothetical protein A2507_00340 [Candidatus Magasanikbacteria bacterium RIFOXYD12_FULL_33_17]